MNLLNTTLYRGFCDVENVILLSRVGIGSGTFFPFGGPWHRIYSTIADKRTLAIYVYKTDESTFGIVANLSRRRHLLLMEDFMLRVYKARREG